jgi:pyruvate ferredoxin oxidoreductase gamma subunit
MFQVRIHGRGGQGVVTAAELLSVSAFLEGQYSQAFPSFGSERMGAPVMAFCRLDNKEIRLREPVMHPDAVIIQDPGLLHQVNLFEGLSETGFVIINSSRNLEELGLGDFKQSHPGCKGCTVPATDLALKNVGRPVPNAALLGGFAAITGLIRLESVEEAIRAKFPEKIAQGNVVAARAAFAAAQAGVC